MIINPTPMPEIPEVTLESIGAAPAGYGLGGRAQVLEQGTDLNDVVATGWYTTNSTSAMKSLINVPEVFMTGGGQPVFRVEICSPAWLVQTAYQIREVSPYLTVVAKRSCVGGTWQPWEYENPPLANGIEYRTTERYNNNPVYEKLENNIFKRYIANGTMVPTESTLMGNVTLYVSPDGSDSTGDGTEAKPFREIQAALNTLPTNLGTSKVTINVAAGEYNKCQVQGFCGGRTYYDASISIVGAGADSTIVSGNVTVWGCHVPVTISGVEFRGTTGGASIYIASNSSFVELSRCSSTHEYGRGFFCYQTNFVRMHNCTISNKTEYGLCSAGSYVECTALTGSNNAVAIKSGDSNSATSGFVMDYGSGITGTTKYKKERSGVIFYNGKEIDTVSTTEMNTAISNAIGTAIGGSY